jgi:hypothetical protein
VQQWKRIRIRARLSKAFSRKNFSGRSLALALFIAKATAKD